MILLIAPLALLAGCATITPPPDLESSRFVVEGVTKADVVAAFVAEGLTVASNQGGIITSTAGELPEFIQVTAVYRANVVDDRVILTGTISNMGNPDRPLHSAMGGDFGNAWEKLERIAVRLKE